MTFLQTLRRLGQVMTSWNHSIDMQAYQLNIIQKLYAKYDLEIILTSYACPEQYEVFKNRNRVAYYRLRHNEFQVYFPDHTGEIIYEASPNGYGIFNDNERLIYMTKAMRQIILKINKKPE